MICFFMYSGNDIGIRMLGPLTLEGAQAKPMHCVKEQFRCGMNIGNNKFPFPHALTQNCLDTGLLQRLELLNKIMEQVVERGPRLVVCRGQMEKAPEVLEPNVGISGKLCAWGIASRKQLLHVGCEILLLRVHDCAEETLLRWEVIVERAFDNTKVGGELLHRHLEEAISGKPLPGGMENSFHFFF